MSTSIIIPQRRQLALSSPSSSLSSGTVSPQTQSAESPSRPSSSHSKDSETSPKAFPDRRPSLLSSSLAAQEHTVINVGHPDGPPRLITCVRYSQGFDWNQEIFLPSHSEYLSHSPDLERKKDPVHEIVLTDEEIRTFFPE